MTISNGEEIVLLATSVRLLLGVYLHGETLKNSCASDCIAKQNRDWGKFVLHYSQVQFCVVIPELLAKLLLKVTLERFN
jgi:hypothetical protein